MPYFLKKDSNLITKKKITLNVIISKDSEKVIKFIENYRSSISTDILNSGEYSFKAFLIQVANHQSNTAVPIQFYPYDKMNDIEKRNVERIQGLLVKEKQIQIPVANRGTLKPKTVVELVQKELGNPQIEKGSKKIDKFNFDTHTRCWKKYKVRPCSNSNTPEKTKSQYCLYDEPNKGYLYTTDWVQFLIEKMQDEQEYNSLYN